MSELTLERLTATELREAWGILDTEERVEGFQQLEPGEAHDFFLTLSHRAQAIIVQALAPRERKIWIRLLAPDDAADMLQELPPEERPAILTLLDEPARSEVKALLAYAEDEAGGLMSPRFARVHLGMTVNEAIHFLRRQARARPETMYYCYVLDSTQRLLGVMSFRDLFIAPPDRLIEEVMETDLVTVPEDMDQEAVARVIGQHDLVAVPVVDTEGRMQGIVTVDDILDVVQEEATEDMHRMGGLEALEAPYLQTGFFAMLKKRAGWLMVLFFGEMLTASAMGRFEAEITRAVVLALFVPLIISSGGNTGSQATTLIIRAMALREVRLKDWWRVIRRELGAGVALGIILASIGLLRVVVWQRLFGLYGPHYLLIGTTVGLSLVGVVTWGTVAGSMLPFIVRRFGFDPATASAPLVATLVDVSGLLIYFSIASWVLRGTLL